MDRGFVTLLTNYTEIKVQFAQMLFIQSYITKRSDGQFGMLEFVTVQHTVLVDKSSFLIQDSPKTLAFLQGKKKKCLFLPHSSDLHFHTSMHVAAHVDKSLESDTAGLVSI